MLEHCPDGNILFGVALHALSRLDTPDQLSELERMLLDMMSSYATPEELKAYGELYRETKNSVRPAGTGLIPEAVLALSDSHPFTREDLERFFDQSKESFVNQSNLTVVDASQPCVLTQSNETSIGTHYTVDPGQVERDGTRTMVFLGAGETLNAPATPTNADPLMVAIRLSAFICLRRSTEGSGSDEPYFTNSSGDDERAHWTYESQYFGKIKTGTYKHFNADAYAFRGPVDRHLAVTFEVWEHDDEGAPWLVALRKCLKDTGQGIVEASEYASGNHQRIDSYVQSAAAVALMMDALIGLIMNHDDLINRGKVIFTRSALEEMLKAQPPTIFCPIVLNGNDRGEYDAGRYQVDFVVERSLVDTTYSLWNWTGRVGASKDHWYMRGFVAAPNCTYAAMADVGGKLHAVLTRGDGMMIYMTLINNKWSYPRTIPGALTRTPHAAALTVRDGCLWVAYQDQDNVPRLMRTYIEKGVDGEWTNMWQGLAPTPTLKYKTYSSPAVVWFRDRFYLAWRRSEEWQPHVPDWDGYGRDQVDVWSWALGASSLVRVDNQSWARDMKTEEGPVMVVFRGNLYIVVVCSKDSYWVRWHKYNHSDGSWSRMPDPPIHQAYDVPSVTVYEDKLYMVIRGPTPLSVTIWDGTKWSPIMLLSIARKKCPAMALHNGELELLYLER